MRALTPFVLLTLWSPVTCQLSLFPDQLQFGPTGLSAVASDTLRVVNASASSYLIDRIDLPDPSFSAIPIGVTTTSIHIGISDTLLVEVQYSPIEIRDHAGTLFLNVAGAARLEIALSGSGVKSVLVIDEVLADPPAGLDGDSNGDGVRHSTEDEFVEILNISRRPVELSGLTVTDQGTKTNAFRFPAGERLPPGGRAVVFGGGIPTGLPGLVFVDDGRIGKGLSNSGDGVVLWNPATGDTLDVMTYGSEGGRNQSLVREPEGVGVWVRHTDPPGRGRFSPGAARPSMVGVRIEPSEVTLEPGAELKLQPIGIFADQETIGLDGRVTYSVDREGIVEIRGDTLIAIGLGSTELIGTFGFYQASSQITVVSGVVDALIPQPVDTLVLIGQSLRYRAVAITLTETTAVGGITLFIDPDSVAAVFGDSVRTLTAGSASVLVRWQDKEATAVLRSAESGDLDGDGRFTLADVLRVIDLVLNTGRVPSEYERISADLTADGSVDLLDLTAVVVRMLGGPVRSKRSATPLPEMIARWSGDVVEIQSGISAVLIVATNLDHFASDWEGTVSQRTTEDGRSVTLMTGIHRTNRLRMHVDRRRVGTILGFDELGRPHLVRIERAAGGHLVCFPNPFNRSAVLRFRLGTSGHVNVTVFSATGQRVARVHNANLGEGHHELVWDGRDESGRRLASGLYVVTLAAKERRDVAKMVLLQ